MLPKVAHVPDDGAPSSANALPQESVDHLAGDVGAVAAVWHPAISLDVQRETSERTGAKRTALDDRDVTPDQRSRVAGVIGLRPSRVLAGVAAPVRQIADDDRAADPPALTVVMLPPCPLDDESEPPQASSGTLQRKPATTTWVHFDPVGIGLPPVAGSVNPTIHPQKQKHAETQILA